MQATQERKFESWELVAHILERVVANLEASRSVSKGTETMPTRFDSSRMPGIPIRDYLARVHQYADCSESCFVLAFIYIDRVLQRNPNFVLGMKSVHRLLLTAAVLAIKYSDDIYADNVVYSRIGGVTLEEINSLESEMLLLLRYELFVSPQLFQQYLAELESHYLQINAEEPTQAQDMLVDSQEDCHKPIQPVASMGNIGTMPSAVDMTEA